VERLLALGVRLNSLAHGANTAHRIVGRDELGELLTSLRELIAELARRFDQ
jgi:hypothetical protein